MYSEEKVENTENVETNANIVDNTFENTTDLNNEETKEVKSSNVVTGIVGAFIGSLIGVALWMGIYYLGYIAAIAGLVIIVCSIKGYEILGGALDKKGVIISGIIALVMVFVANHLSWTMDVYVEFNEYEKVSFSDVFRAMPDFIKAFELQADYLKDLGVGYALTLFGGASTLASKFKQTKNKK